MVPGRARRLGPGGFTLVELIVVIALTGVLFTIGIPLFLSYWQTSTVQAGAQEMRAALQQAKQLAITTRQNICVQAVTNGYQFRQVTCGGAAWVGLGTDGAGTFRLQNSVTVSVAAGPPVFTWLGAAAPAGSFTVTGPTGNTLTVTVAAGGRITVGP